MKKNAAFEKKFRPGAVKEAIHQTLNEVLMGQMYENERVTEWCKQISDGVKDRVKEMGYDRYKVSGERKNCIQSAVK